MNTSGEEKRNFTPSINKVLFTKAITPEQKEVIIDLSRA